MFSCEFCETSENIFFIEHFWTTASVVCLLFCTELLGNGDQNTTTLYETWTIYLTHSFL